MYTTLWHMYNTTGPWARHNMNRKPSQLGNVLSTRHCCQQNTTHPSAVRQVHPAASPCLGHGKHPSLQAPAPQAPCSILMCLCASTLPNQVNSTSRALRTTTNTTTLILRRVRAGVAATASTLSTYLNAASFPLP